MTKDVHVGIIPITDDNRADLARFAVVHRISGTMCPVCNHTYTDYEDIISRNPKAGVFLESVCAVCWDKYVETVLRFAEEFAIGGKQ